MAAFSTFLVCFSNLWNSSFRRRISAVNCRLDADKAALAAVQTPSWRSAMSFACKYSAALRSAIAARLVASVRESCKWLCALSRALLSGAFQLWFGHVVGVEGKVLVVEGKGDVLG